MCLMLYDEFWMDATYIILCCLDANYGFSHSFDEATCPQVEPDVDHTLSTTPQQYTPIFSNGIRHDRRGRAVQIPSSVDNFMNNVNDVNDLSKTVNVCNNLGKPSMLLMISILGGFLSH